MATLTLDTSTPQVRPIAGGAWNNITLTQGQIGKGQTFGATLIPAFKQLAMQACNEFVNDRDAGTSDRVAQKTARATGIEVRDMVVLGTGQTGNATTTNVLDRGVQSGYGQVEIVTTVGATPTVTVQVEGSADNGSWAALSTADSATPTTFSTATFAITTATTTVRIINPAATSARYIRLTTSLNTNVTFTTNAAVA